MKKLIGLLVLSALAVMGADLNGTWKGTAESQNGTIERTFIFKVDGAKLTGEAISEMFGKSAIENGKVEGDAVSFQIKVKFQEEERTMSYTGKLAGETLTLEAKGFGDMVIKWTCKKQ